MPLESEYLVEQFGTRLVSGGGHGTRHHNDAASNVTGNATGRSYEEAKRWIG